MLRKTPTKRGLIATLIVVPLVVVLVMVAAPAVVSSKAVRASKEDSFRGLITQVNRAKHKFTVKGPGHHHGPGHHKPHGKVTIKANKGTQYTNNLRGFGSLHKGLKVGVRAHKKNGRLIADKARDICGHRPSRGHLERFRCHR